MCQLAEVPIEFDLLEQKNEAKSRHLLDGNEQSLNILQVYGIECGCIR